VCDWAHVQDTEAADDIEDEPLPVPVAAAGANRTSRSFSRGASMARDGSFSPATAAAGPGRQPNARFSEPAARQSIPAAPQQSDVPFLLRLLRQICACLRRSFGRNST